MSLDRIAKISQENIERIRLHPAYKECQEEFDSAGKDMISAYPNSRMRDRFIENARIQYIRSLVESLDEEDYFIVRNLGNDSVNSRAYSNLAKLQFVRDNSHFLPKEQRPTLTLQDLANKEYVKIKPNPLTYLRK